MGSPEDLRALSNTLAACYVILLRLYPTRFKSYRAPRSSRTLVWLVKHHARYPRLDSAPPTISAFEGECIAEAQRILDERVSEKAMRFRGIPSPRVLLLWDATSLLETEHFLRATRRRDWPESIEAAYLLRESQEVHELWSAIDGW